MSMDGGVMVAKLSRLDVDSDPLIICEDDARCVIPKLIFNFESFGALRFIQTSQLFSCS